MTFIGLEDALIDKITEILSEVHTTATDGTVVNGVQGYRHQLPVMMADEDDVSKYFPYFIVRLDSGTTKTDDDWWHVSVNVIFGTHDASLSDGHEHVLVMCQRVSDYFNKYPLLNKRYRAEAEMTFVLEDTDTYPYNFAGLNMKFGVPKIGRDQLYA